MNNSNDNAALAHVLAESGVKITLGDAEAVGRALARIHAAATTLFASSAFDDTTEQYFRLLDNDSAAGSGT